MVNKQNERPKRELFWSIEISIHSAVGILHGEKQWGADGSLLGCHDSPLSSHGFLVINSSTSISLLA